MSTKPRRPVEIPFHKDGGLVGDEIDLRDPNLRKKYVWKADPVLHCRMRLVDVLGGWSGPVAIMQEVVKTPPGKHPPLFRMTCADFWDMIENITLTKGVTPNMKWGFHKRGTKYSMHRIP